MLISLSDRGGMKRIWVAALSIFLLLVSSSGSSSAGKVSLHLGLGASKVTGNIYEDTEFRAIPAIDLFYTITENIQLGFHAGYTKWTPNNFKKDSGICGSSRMIEGTVGNTELMGLARFEIPSEKIERLSLFVEACLGCCIIDSNALVYSRPVIPDPGAWDLMYPIKSQNKPCAGAGLGLNLRVTDKFGLESIARYNRVFTDDESTCYYSINGCLVIWLF